MLNVTGGLDYAFSKAVTHRDLRMSNILISSRGQAKLVDFGLATADEALGADELDFEMPSTRTIDYAALERATGVRKDDPRSDIYFAGCIYYNMLVGKPPLMEVKNRVQRLSKTRFLEIPPIHKAQPSLPHYVTSIVNKSMALDPGRRYQRPGEMSIDLQNIMKRLEEEGPPAETSHVAMFEPNALAPLPQDENDPSEPQRSVMVVESNVQMQDVFREGLKKAGFRVLMTSDPQRAYDRINQDLGLVDCLLLNAQEVGEPALHTFNRLAEDSATEAVPVILLLGKSQMAWKKRARTADHRLVLSMPITLRDLRIVLAKLLPTDPASQSNAS
jgi:serine/threonine protein kinase